MGVEGTYPAIIFIFNQGKTNKDGKTTESGACIQNVNDDFDNEDDYSSEDVASFVGRSHWEIPLSNSAQTRFMRDAFDRAGVSIVGKTTHAPRICATQIADNFGIPAAQISRMDAAVMMDMIPDHPIWRHKIFKTQLFIDFKRKVNNAHVDTDEQPDSSIISKFALEVKQQLQGVRNMISTIMAEVNERQAASDNTTQQLHRRIIDIISGNQPLQMSVSFNDSGASASVQNYTTHPSASCPPIPAVDTNNASSPLTSSAAIDTTSPN
ncbi:hypothetical protein [Parasitella parasitica]|uniref:Ndc10 domain-containing protein n=1 Tax=Parasitella parasitica TaxID=35722 RepID=A0A0B7NG66_9FUNG|nr:hypothetical protein [Parasitella parasitica]